MFVCFVLTSHTCVYIIGVVLNYYILCMFVSFVLAFHICVYIVGVVLNYYILCMFVSFVLAFHTCVYIVGVIMNYYIDMYCFSYRVVIYGLLLMIALYHHTKTSINFLCFDMNFQCLICHVFINSQLLQILTTFISINALT